MAKTYENGFAQGKTEASLEGLAKGMDILRDQFAGLPCGKQGANIAALQTAQKYLWALMFFLVAALGGLVLTSIFG